MCILIRVQGVGEEADADAGAAKSGEEKDGKEGKNGEDGSDGEANENDGDEDFEMVFQSDLSFKALLHIASSHLSCLIIG